MNYRKLPLVFDSGRLASDLSNLCSAEWPEHFNRGMFDGDWSGLPLRAPEGVVLPALALSPEPRFLSPGGKTPDGRTWVDTPFLESSPYFREVLASLACPTTSVRLLRLGAGSTIGEHVDYNLAFEEGHIRLHIPVATNPEVEFILAGERIEMAVGETWYLNFNLPHRVANRGGSDRIHLVIDCRVNAWMRELFERG